MRRLQVEQTSFKSAMSKRTMPLFHSPQVQIGYEADQEQAPQTSQVSWMCQ